MTALESLMRQQQAVDALAMQHLDCAEVFNALASRRAQELFMPIKQRPAAPSMTPTLDKPAQADDGGFADYLDKCAAEILRKHDDNHNAAMCARDERERTPLPYFTEGADFNPFKGFTTGSNGARTTGLPNNGRHPLQRLSCTDAAMVDPMHALLATRGAIGPQAETAVAGLAAAGTR